jgi:glyoxylase-like metal-dependent hydrolase (beta-lactamase superfamily II)
MRLVLRILVILFLLVVLAAAGGLTWAHVAIRREAAPLPSLDAINAAAGVGTIVDDAPRALSVINTASQGMSRSAVLDAGRDPRPQEPYMMSHPSFVLEWKDGRILLVDVGMTRDGALAMGRPIELLGAEPIVPVVSAATALGGAAARVKGILFTHLHTDHVGGIAELCDRIRQPVQVPMTEAQAERPNYTTRPGLSLLTAAECARLETLHGGPLLPVPGFPGVYLIDAGGHTPGSQIILAFVQGPDGPHRYAFAGDIVNHLDGITEDIPKPFLYRTLVVPESDERQAELRRFLKRLHDEAGFTLLVSHDQRALAAAGLPAWAEIVEQTGGQ